MIDGVEHFVSFWTCSKKKISDCVDHRRRKSCKFIYHNTPMASSVWLNNELSFLYSTQHHVPACQFQFTFYVVRNFLHAVHSEMGRRLEWKFSKMRCGSKCCWGDFLEIFMRLDLSLNFIEKLFCEINSESAAKFQSRQFIVDF